MTDVCNYVRPSPFYTMLPPAQGGMVRKELHHKYDRVILQPVRRDGNENVSDHADATKCDCSSMANLTYDLGALPRR